MTSFSASIFLFSFCMDYPSVSRVKFWNHPPSLCEGQHVILAVAVFLCDLCVLVFVHRCLEWFSWIRSLTSMPCPSLVLLIHFGLKYTLSDIKYLHWLASWVHLLGIFFSILVCWGDVCPWCKVCFLKAVEGWILFFVCMFVFINLWFLVGELRPLMLRVISEQCLLIPVIFLVLVWAPPLLICWSEIIYSSLFFIILSLSVINLFRLKFSF